MIAKKLVYYHAYRVKGGVWICEDPETGCRDYFNERWQAEAFAEAGPQQDAHVDAFWEDQRAFARSHGFAC